jgi:hypothetical protein
VADDEEKGAARENAPLSVEQSSFLRRSWRTEELLYRSAHPFMPRSDADKCNSESSFMLTP